MKISLKHNKLKYRKDILPLYILLATACGKWLFEGVLGQPIFEAVMLAAALGLLVIRRGVKINGLSAVWLLYIINIFFSVLFHDPSVGRIGRVLVMMEIVCFMLFEKYDQNKYPQIYDFIIKLAFIYGFFVLLQLILRERFNNVYFPQLIDEYKYVANHYYRQGYFFGLIFNPHEIAYLLAVAFVALVLWQVISYKFDLFRVACCVILFSLQLLTQKKGVIFLSLLSLVLIMLILFATRKQWIRIIKLLVFLGIACVIFLCIFRNHSDSVLLYRILQFFEKISNNENADSGRSLLQQYAVNEFMQHKVFGIGWRKFNSLTTSFFGYSSGHEVNFDYLQWLCETGIVGFTMNIIPILTMLFRTFFVCTKYIRSEKNLRVKWSVLIAVFSQFFTVIYAFIEIPFYDILVFTIYVISCIVINAAYLKNKRQKFDQRTNSLQIE